MAGELLVNQVLLGESADPSDNFFIQAPLVAGGDLRIVRGTTGGEIATPFRIEADGLVRMIGGKVLKVAHAEDNTYVTGTALMPLDDTIPQISEGTQFLAITYTPLRADSSLLIEVDIHLNPTVAAWITTALFRDNDPNAIAGWPSYQATNTGAISYRYSKLIQAGSVAPRSYSVRSGMNTAGTLRMNGSASRLLGGVLSSYIKITELSA